MKKNIYTAIVLAVALVSLFLLIADSESMSFFGFILVKAIAGFALVASSRIFVKLNPEEN